MSRRDNFEVKWAEEFLRAAHVMVRGMIENLAESETRAELRALRVVLSEASNHLLEHLEAEPKEAEQVEPDAEVRSPGM